MAIKCKRCFNEFEGRKGKQFCSAICKSSFWVESKRFKKKKEYIDTLIRKSSGLTLNQDVIDLFNAINKKNNN